MKPIKMLITNAASKTTFTFLPMLCSGNVFGQHQKLDLILFAFKPLIEEVEMLKNDLNECCYPLLDRVEVTSDIRKAFKGVDVAILLELERNVIGFRNNSILFRAYGLLLNANANKNVKVLVSGRTANTSAFVCSSFAPSIHPQNFTVLAQNVKHFLKATVKSSVSRTSCPQIMHTDDLSDCSNCTSIPGLTNNESVNSNNDKISTVDSEDVMVWGSCSYPIISILNKDGHFHLKDIKLGLEGPGSLVTAKAMAEHLYYWLGKWKQIESNRIICMGVVTSGNHLGIENDLYFNLPVEFKETDSDPLEYSRHLQKDEDFIQELKEASDRLSKERDSAIVDCWRVVLPHSHM